MLRITPDVFSGRPNPTFDVVDESAARAVLRDLTRDRDLLASASEPPSGGLGLRGFWVEPLGDELGHDAGITSRLYLPAGAQARGGRAAELAEQLIDLASRGEPAEGIGTRAVPLDGSLRSLLLAQLETSGQITGTDAVTAAPGAPDESDESEVAVTCQIETGAFNPGFWNDDPNVRANNNCYNYASNWRTNTFAQPGRGCGSQYTQITCAEVIRAALCDGMHHRFDCFPDSEKPRYLVALVVIPGGGDFHWYRKQKEGFWGHKPGGTAARNYDNSGNVIYNPETADRGPYTIFCGYFYGCNSQRQRIR